MAHEIASFRGEYGYLGNFWFCPIRLPGIVYPRQIIRSLWPYVRDEMVFPTAEHAYQAAKMADRNGYTAVSIARHPADAKKRAKEHRMASGWDETRLTVMRVVLAEKFAQNPNLAQKLKATGDALLVEGNTWHDVFWGRCICRMHHGMGENQLGQMLMFLRSGLAQA